MKNKYDCFNPSIKRIIVHAGKFDADAVLCIAMTMCVNENIEIFRVGRVTDDMYNEDNIVCDIGYGKYDHHQENAPKREDGYTHSACGLLFEERKSS